MLYEIIWNVFPKGSCCIRVDLFSLIRLMIIKAKLTNKDIATMVNTVMANQMTNLACISSDDMNRIVWYLVWYTDDVDDNDKKSAPHYTATTHHIQQIVLLYPKRRTSTRTAPAQMVFIYLLQISHYSVPFHYNIYILFYSHRRICKS